MIEAVSGSTFEWIRSIEIYEMWAKSWRFKFGWLLVTDTCRKRITDRVTLEWIRCSKNIAALQNLKPWKFECPTVLSINISSECQFLFDDYYYISPFKDRKGAICTRAPKNVFSEVSENISAFLASKSIFFEYLFWGLLRWMFSFGQIEK